jgi:hypothetical protein
MKAFSFLKMNITAMPRLFISVFYHLVAMVVSVCHLA